MIFMRKKRLKNTKGFTLVELIVVLALVSILLAGGAGGLFAYSRYAARRQEQEYARSIYYAAQAALTHAKASGMLDALRSRAEEAENLPEAVGSLSGTAGSLPETAGETQSRWYLTKKKQEKDSVLGELLEPYMTEDILTDAALYLEADLETGIVYTAGYSSRADEFLSGQDGPVAVLYDSLEGRNGSYREETGAGIYETKTQKIETE